MDYSVTNIQASHTLCELELWPPPQGANESCLPLSVDVRFGKHLVQLPSFSATIRATRAEIIDSLSEVCVIQNSRFGDEILEPYEVSEVVESANILAEASGDFDIKGRLSLIAGIFGGFAAKLHKRRTRNKENDTKLRAMVRRQRVSYRTNNRWELREPVSPGILTGRYLGFRTTTDLGEKSDPLFLFQVLASNAKVDVFLCVHKEDLIASIEKRDSISVPRNKEAIIQQLLSRSLVKNSLASRAVMPDFQNASVMCHSWLEVKHDI